MMLKPLGDRVLVKFKAAEEISPGGIIIPDSVKEKPSEGNVIAVGEAVEWVDAGDKVFFGKYTGIEFEMEKERYVVLKEEDILGKFIDEKKA